MMKKLASGLNKAKSVLAASVVGACMLATNVYADVAGDWEGVLKVKEGVKLPLVIHLKQENGVWQGSLDSPAQGGYDMKMSKVEVDGDKVLFELSNLQIHYEGNYNKTTQAIKGTFIQGKPFPLNFSKVDQDARKAQALISDVTESSKVALGSWNGNIETPMGPLAFVIHIKDEAGQLVATADSPDQNGFGMPVDAIGFDNGNLTFKMKKLGVVYKGKYDEANQEFVGTFSQAGTDMPLVLDKKKLENKQSQRPQTPKGPFPYTEEEVSFANPSAAISLAGTLTKPKGKIKATAVLITGSGPQDRDETIMRHKPFAVIADHLTRQGYAVLRFDDRGVGGSTGDFQVATSEDFVSDVSAAVDYLKSRSDIPNHSIGLIGHSEGGMIAPMVAASRKDIAFNVLLAGPGVKTVELYIEQRNRLLSFNGVNSANLAKVRELDHKIFSKINQLPDDSPISEDIRGLLAESVQLIGVSGEATVNNQVDMMAKTYTSPWFRYFLKFNPQPYLAKVKSPVLAINGSLDVQVVAEQNLTGIEQVLRQAGHKDFEVKELAQLNHLFQTAETGAVSEYALIEETFAPAALYAVSDWLNQRF